MLVGVQSNQFPRALDIATPLARQRDPKVVSAAFTSRARSRCSRSAIRTSKGRGDGHLAVRGRSGRALGASAARCLRRRAPALYNFMNDLPNLEHAAPPLLPARRVTTAGSITSFDAGRGCPYQCSFCTIINVQGPQIAPPLAGRCRRDPREHRAGLALVLHYRRQFCPQPRLGGDPRPPDPAPRSGRAGDELHHSGGHALPQLANFVEKPARAGVGGCSWAGEHQPGPSPARRRARTRSPNTARCCWPGGRPVVTTYCGYITGFPGDTPESILRDIERDSKGAAGRSAGVLYLTPLPGSEDHKKLHEAGVAMDADLNRYDLNHTPRPIPR